MPDRVEEIAAQGRTLTQEDRVRLMDLSPESLDEPATGSIDKAWAAEIKRRLLAHDGGEGELFDVEDVMADAEKLAS